MPTELPKRGVVFWPVGTGDSTTIVIKEDAVVMQIDLHQMEKSKEDDDPHCEIVQELVDSLPKKNGKPYLSVFALTHPDQDHIKGFGELLKKVMIGEIWHTPRIFKEYKKDLCGDAKKFKDEVVRRRDVTIKKKGDVKAGDRLRVIGHDDLFKDDEDYRDFPEEWRSYPGNSVTKVDGEEQKDVFEAFIHAPFKEDSAAERNNTSLSLHITLTKDKKTGKLFIFGDREYPTIKKIFDKTREKKRTQYLEWDVMLASHHCSKKVMYWKDEADSDEKFKQDIMDDFEEFKKDGAYVIVSAESDFTDGDGDNPPHKKARKRYEEIVESGHFLCTQEHLNEKKPKPIKFEMTSKGLTYQKPVDADESDKKKSGLAVAVERARGEDQPHSKKVGFGSK